MMSANTIESGDQAFGTIKFVEQLTAAGVPPGQAEAEDLQSSGLELATRSDLNAPESRRGARISDAKVDIINWIASLLIAHAAVTAVLVKLL
jgi:hypothetical protein